MAVMKTLHYCTCPPFRSCLRAQQRKVQTRPPNWTSPQRPTRTTFFASLITKLLVVSEPPPLPSPSQAEASAPLANPTPCTAKEGLFVGGRTVAQATMLEISSLFVRGRTAHREDGWAEKDLQQRCNFTKFGCVPCKKRICDECAVGWDHRTKTTSRTDWKTKKHPPKKVITKKK